MSEYTETFNSKSRDASGADLEKLRADYFTQALMSDNDVESIGGIRIAPVIREQTHHRDKKKRAQELLTILLLIEQLNQRLAALDASLIDKYGQNFAEDLAAQYLDADYKQLTSIEDPEERRKAIAAAINEGIANGTIDPTEIYADTELKEWLDIHRDKQDLILENLETQTLEQGYDRINTQSEEAAFDTAFSALDKISPP